MNILNKQLIQSNTEIKYVFIRTKEEPQQAVRKTR